MEQKTKNILIWVSVIVIILSIVAFYLYKYTSLPKVAYQKITGQNPDINATGAFVGDYGDEVNTDKVLSFGDKSNNVVRLQSAINDIITKYFYPISKLSTDGVYGAKTASALKFISNDTLKSGNVTVNKVMNLSKVGAIVPDNAYIGAGAAAFRSSTIGTEMRTIPMPSSGVCPAGWQTGADGTYCRLMTPPKTVGGANL